MCPDHLCCGRPTRSNERRVKTRKKPFLFPFTERRYFRRQILANQIVRQFSCILLTWLGCYYRPTASAGLASYPLDAIRRPMTRTMTSGSISRCSMLVPSYVVFPSLLNGDYFVPLESPRRAQNHCSRVLMCYHSMTSFKNQHVLFDKAYCSGMCLAARSTPAFNFSYDGCFKFM